MAIRRMTSRSRLRRAYVGARDIAACRFLRVPRASPHAPGLQVTGPFGSAKKESTMTLITQAQLAQLLANGKPQRAAIDNDQGAIDFKPVVKLFTPDAQCTWLLTELDPDHELAFGLCDLGMGEPELGYVSLTELRTVRGKLGLPIERDEQFDADKPLSVYADEARQYGGIVT
jgi:hypothetical protein